MEFTKGLEFDAVLILDPDRKAYPSDDGNAKLLYVAATRALHELCVLHEGDLTGLIADPVPRKALQGKAPQKNILQRNTTEKNIPHEKEAADRAAGKKRISIVRNTAPEPERPAAARPASGSDRPAAVRLTAGASSASPVSSGPGGKEAPMRATHRCSCGKGPVQTVRPAGCPPREDGAEREAMTALLRSAICRTRIICVPQAVQGRIWRCAGAP